MAAMLDKQSRRILAYLAKGEAALERNGRDAVLTHRGSALMPIDPSALRDLTMRGLVLRNGSYVGLTATGRRLLADGQDPAGAAADRDREQVTIHTPSGPQCAIRNIGESPLAKLHRRKAGDGSRFLTPKEFDAGEKLREDYTKAMAMPRLGANWDSAVSSGKRRAGPGGSVHLTEMALAARLRVEKALEAVGPEMSGLLIDVCCFLKGLERVEAERSWPARSAKIVLKTALSILARHYFPVESGRSGIQHWGAQDFRPELPR